MVTTAFSTDHLTLLCLVPPFTFLSRSIYPCSPWSNFASCLGEQGLVIIGVKCWDDSSFWINLLYFISAYFLRYVFVLCIESTLNYKRIFFIISASDFSFCIIYWTHVYWAENKVGRSARTDRSRLKQPWASCKTAMQRLIPRHRLVLPTPLKLGHPKPTLVRFCLVWFAVGLK